MLETSSNGELKAANQRVKQSRKRQSVNNMNYPKYTSMFLNFLAFSQTLSYLILSNVMSRLINVNCYYSFFLLSFQQIIWPLIWLARFEKSTESDFQAKSY